MNYSLLWKPKRLARSISNRFARWVEMRRAIDISEKRFKNDPNYRLDLVQDDFAPRLGDVQDDSEIIERIIRAYKKAKVDQLSAGEAFNVSNEWLPIYEKNLVSMMRALSSENVDELQRMYQNFFRDPCSMGLVGLPVNMLKVFLDGKIDEKYKKYALADSLHRHDLWKKRTNYKYPIETLSSPLVGNPYGYTISGVFVRSGADYHHYYAQEIQQLLNSTRNNTVIELGGGFGGHAYFLLCDRPDITYFDFDLPETLALASYYLLKTLPNRHITLYGEAESLSEPFGSPGIFMMPSFEIMKLRAKSVAVSFNSYSLAEMSPQAIHTYIEQIARITNGYFLHINHNRNAVLGADDFGIKNYKFKCVRRKLAEWTLGINPNSDEFEYLYVDESS